MLFEKGLKVLALGGTGGSQPHIDADGGTFAGREKVTTEIPCPKLL